MDEIMYTIRDCAEQSDIPVETVLFNLIMVLKSGIDALITEFSWTFYDECGQLTPNGEEILGTLKKILSAQKKGHWSRHLCIPHTNFCSCCGKDSPYDKRWEFCPNCGADMRGEADGENS